MNYKLLLLLALTTLAIAQPPKAVQGADGNWYSATQGPQGFVLEKRSADFATLLWRQSADFPGLHDLRLTPDGGVALFASANNGDAALWRWDADGVEKLRLPLRVASASMTVDTNGDFLIAYSPLTILRLGPDGVEKNRRTIPAAGLDFASAIEVDGRGALYAIGTTMVTTLPVSPDAYQRAPRGGNCLLVFRNPTVYPCRAGWVARLDTASFNLDALSYLGGGDENYLAGLALDADRLPVVVGFAIQRKPDQDPYPQTANTARTFAQGTGSVLTISRMSSRLDTLLDSTWLRGGQTATGAGIAIDRDGQILLTGTTTSPDFPGTSDPASVCGPVRGPNATAWNLGLRLSPRLEHVERTLHLNEAIAPSRLPLESKVDCLLDGSTYEYARNFASGQIASILGGPFSDTDEVRINGIKAQELYRDPRQINFTIPRELGVLDNAVVRVGGMPARTLTIEAARPRWILYISPDGKLFSRGNFLINARRADGSLNTDDAPIPATDEVRAYATGIDLAEPLQLFANFYDQPYANFTASYVPGTFDSVVEFRFPNPASTVRHGGIIVMGLVNGGAYSGSNPGYIWSAAP